MSRTENSIDCRGLSGVLTVIRIKQAFTDWDDGGCGLDVMVDPDCNCGRLIEALSDEDGEIRFMACTDATLSPHIISAMASKTQRTHV